VEAVASKEETIWDLESYMMQLVPNVVKSVKYPLNLMKESPFIVKIVTLK
jgi:hypothetical protein